MSELPLLAAVPPASARPDRTKPVETAPAGAARAPGATEITSKSKVMTDYRSSYAFTYTFFDARTLEVISRWPQTPIYRLQGSHVPIGAAVETVV